MFHRERASNLYTQALLYPRSPGRVSKCGASGDGAAVQFQMDGGAVGGVDLKLLGGGKMVGVAGQDVGVELDEVVGNDAHVRGHGGGDGEFEFIGVALGFPVPAGASGLIWRRMLAGGMQR